MQDLLLIIMFDHPYVQSERSGACWKEEENDMFFFSAFIIRSEFFFFFYYHVWLCLSCNLFFSLVIALHLFSTTQHSIQPRSMANAGNIEAFNVKYKVLLLGDTLVGKTSLQRFMAGRDFRPDIGSTIGKNEIFCLWRTLDISVGVDFVNKIIPIERAKVNLQIWWRENVWELFAWIIESV